MFKKKALNDNQILIFVRLINASKSFIAMTVSRQITGGLFTGVRRTAIEWWEYFIYGDSEGLGWV